MARELNIVCPAGVPIGEVRNVGGAGCRCRIEENTIDRHSPKTLSENCADEFAECPTWQAMKEAVFRDRDRALERAIARTAD